MVLVGPSTLGVDYGFCNIRAPARCDGDDIELELDVHEYV